MKELFICGCALLLTLAAFALHPALGILVGMLSVGAVDGLLTE
jgi:hypothetical protein